jgi:hypothetical protein
LGIPGFGIEAVLYRWGKPAFDRAEKKIAIFPDIKLLLMKKANYLY